MANVDLYQNKLKQILDGNFQGTEGFDFAMKQGTQALNRSNSRMRGSGNALAALTQYGTGLALQDRGAEMDRLGRLSGQEQQYDLGQGQNANVATRNANDLALGTEQNRLTGVRDNNTFTLGQGQNQNQVDRNANDLALGTAQNANTAQRNAWDYQLGQGQNANTRTANDQQFGLGMYRAGNDYALGSQTNANNAQRNWWDNVNTRDANSINAAGQQNTFNTNQGRNDIDWYNAQTNRGTAQSNDYYRRRNGGY